MKLDACLQQSTGVGLEVPAGRQSVKFIMTTPRQEKADDTLTPKLLLMTAVLYVGATEFANWSAWVQIVVGATILLFALAMIVSGRFGVKDKAWGAASVGIVFGILVPLIGHLIRP